jgi:plasmid stabilization system protein ParE
VRVTFNELAERELNDAAQYYEHEESGLGQSFIGEVRRCVAGIVEHPEAGPIVLGTIRASSLSAVPLRLALRSYRQ